MTKAEVYALATNTRACDIFGHRFDFDGVSTVHTNTICMHFRLNHFQLRAFSNRCVFDENANAKRISVSGRSRRIEMHAFSNENALVCTEFKSMSLEINYDIACEQALRGALAAGREEKGELATTSMEFEFHLQPPWPPVD